MKQFMLRALPLVILIASLLTTGCGGGGSSVTPPPGPGSLTVTVTGVPSGSTASIVVSGPSGFSQTITQTTTLTDLSPGTYSLAAPILTPTSGTSLTVPVYSSNPATVSAGTTATSAVAYGSLPLSWTSLGPRHIYTNFLSGTYGAGQIAAIAVNNANPSIIYAGCAGWFGPASSTGIYKTTNGGVNWTPSDTGLTDPAVAVIWLDQANPNILVAGTLNIGLFRSTDAGANWQAVSPAFGPTTALLQVGSSLYAGTSQGIALSQDDGATWNLIEPATAWIQSLAASGTYIYAGRGDGAVIVQSNPGATWLISQPLAFDGNNSISADPANPLHAIAVEQGYYETPDVWETQDGGNTWQSYNPMQWAIQYLAFDPSDATGQTVYAGADYQFTGSADGGLTWTQLTSAGDLRIVVPKFGGAPGLTVAGSDQGIFSSTDGGNSWTSLNGDLTTSLAYWIDISGNTIVLAMQDYSMISSFDGGNTWTNSQSANTPCGEGGLVLINPGNPQFVYNYNPACGFWVSTDGGMNYQSLNSVLDAPQYPCCSPQVIAVDPQAPAHVFAAAQAWNTTPPRPQGIFESTDSGVSFALKWPTTQVPSLVAFDPTNDKNVFVGQQDGTLQVSHDGGETWTSTLLGGTGTSSEPVSSWPVSLSINPASPNLVMVGMSGPPEQSDGGVLFSSDGGSTFTPASAGLGPNPLLYPQPWPDPLFAVAYDPSGSGLAAAARWDGIYLSSDNGGHWVSAQGNAVPIGFTDIKWASGSVYATTFGEGVVQLPVQIQTSQALIRKR
ncbi:exported hypothetical protein [Candidatus Sulfotelmatobacter kueseliae]|uniref:Uncharacterized protein n=1 Tax=Candidatus Sulfotelmatobacter kueseliae TaxID=2042962 RepID=A0A2U3KWX1_9BACT|nr:exported hypothetical protein [Candidatus Sulfotelmatobacter kueseliae]